MSTRSSDVESELSIAAAAEPPKRPPNRFKRMNEPKRASSALVTFEKDVASGDIKVKCDVFIDPTNPLFRPLVFSEPAATAACSQLPKPSPIKDTLADQKRADAHETKKDAEEHLLTPSKQRLFLSPDGQHKRFPFPAKTPGGTEMSSERSVEFRKRGERPATLWFFSPGDREPEAAVKAHQPKKGVKRKATAIDFTAKAASVTHSERSLRTPSPPPSSPSSPPLSPTDPVAKPELPELKVREEATTVNLCKRVRKIFPKQNTVKGSSAKNAMLDDLARNEKRLPDNIVSILKSLVENFQIEWLHCLAFSLTPKDKNPQRPENLASAGSWINTQMMPLEQLAYYFADKYPGAVDVKSLFFVFDESDVLVRVEYEVTITKGGSTIVLSNSIEALEMPSRCNWPSDTDFAQLTWVVNAKLGDEPPHSSTTFRI